MFAYFLLLEWMESGIYSKGKANYIDDLPPCLLPFTLHLYMTVHQQAFSYTFLFLSAGLSSKQILTIPRFRIGNQGKEGKTIIFCFNL